MSKAHKELFWCLEAGRSVAACTVMMTHFTGDLSRYGTGRVAHFFASLPIPGPFAAQYFFVLSGFVLMSAHRKDFGHASAVPQFWWRRACRIYPMYWIAFFIVSLYLYPALTPRVTFLQMTLLPASVTEFVSPAWTLRYEVAFYIMFGLCLLPYVGRILLAAWVFCVFWLWRPPALSGFLLCAPTAWLKHVSGHVPLFFSPFVIYYFMGMAAGLIRLTTPKSGMAAILLGAVILAAAAPWYGWGLTYGGPLMPAVTGTGFGAVMIGIAALERSGTLRMGIWSRRLGIVSYPLYILHVPIMLCVDEHIWGRWHFHGLGLIAFGAAYLSLLFGLSAAAAFLIDQPLQRRFRKMRLPVGRLREGTA